ncbi:hypothetical protein P9112_006187 [Eukaryota sp. TZLM1-RC]
MAHLGSLLAKVFAVRFPEDSHCLTQHQFWIQCLDFVAVSKPKLRYSFNRPGKGHILEQTDGQFNRLSLSNNPATTPKPSRPEKKAVHGEDENGNPCVFWVPRSQVLSSNPSISKSLSGDLSVSDLDISPPILLPSNAVDFDIAKASRKVALTNEIAGLTQLTETHKACTHRATHHPKYVPLNERYDEQVHEWDIFRAGTKINPAGISSCVDTDVISTLAMFAGGIIPGLQLHQINDEELWENILFASQFPYLATAKLTLSRVKMDYNIPNYQSRWIKCISPVGFVVVQSLGMRNTLASNRFQPYQKVIKLEEWDIAFSILDNLGMHPLFNELFKSWTYSSVDVKRRLSDFIDVFF